MIKCNLKKLFSLLNMLGGVIKQCVPQLWSLPLLFMITLNKQHWAMTLACIYEYCVFLERAMPNGKSKTDMRVTNASAMAQMKHKYW